MNLDDRGRAAAVDLRRAFTSTERFGAGVELERLHDERLRRARHQRWRAGLVAAAITIVAIVLLASVLRDRSASVPANPVAVGTVLYGRWNPKAEHARWFTSNIDGSDVRDLGVTATCARWVPGGRHPHHERRGVLPGSSLAAGDRAFRWIRRATPRGNEGSIAEPRVRRRVARRPVDRARGIHRRREPERHLPGPRFRRRRAPGRERERAG
jgi:hypothetical protein